MEKIFVRLVYALILSISLFSSSKANPTTVPTITDLMKRDKNVTCEYRKYFVESELLEPCQNLKYPDKAELTLANIDTFLCLGAYDALYKVCNYNNRHLLSKNDINSTAKFTDSVKKFIPEAKQDKVAVEQSFCKSLEGLKSAYERTNETVLQVLEKLNDVGMCPTLCFGLNFHFNPLCAIMAWIRNTDQEVIDLIQKKTLTNVSNTETTEKQKSGNIAINTNINQNVNPIENPNSRMENEEEGIDKSIPGPKESLKPKGTIKTPSGPGAGSLIITTDNKQIEEYVDGSKHEKLINIHENNELGSLANEHKPSLNIPEKEPEEIAQVGDQTKSSTSHPVSQSSQPSQPPQPAQPAQPPQLAQPAQPPQSPLSPQIPKAQDKALSQNEQPVMEQETKNNKVNDKPSLNDQMNPPDELGTTKTEDISDNTNNDLNMDNLPSQDNEDMLGFEENMELPSEMGNQKDSFGPSDQRNILSHYPNMRNEDDSHFFTYFTIITLVCIAGYVGYHNKQKVLAIVLEGRRSRSSRGRRRPSTANYRKLDCTLEEAVTSQCNANVTHVIY